MCIRDRLKLKKCFFFRDEVEYLGHRIRPGTLSVSRESKVTRAIEKAVFPQTLTQMRSFLGAANVYRRFIRGYADIARPLQDMTKKDSGVRWDGPNEIVPTDEQREAFEALKSALVSPPVLALPVRGRPFMIDCDASEYAICLLYTSPSPRDRTRSRMPSSA